MERGFAIVTGGNRGNGYDSYRYGNLDCFQALLDSFFQ